eukprot:255277-Prymnesium_polylepis.1
MVAGSQQSQRRPIDLKSVQAADERKADPFASLACGVSNKKITCLKVAAGRLKRKAVGDVAGLRALPGTRVVDSSRLARSHAMGLTYWRGPAVARR